ncbi:MAG: tetratricopeptide repeat protein, partial [Myxococcales bacterium]|nr:tetratricopeptide repeat protein [Myxococcales bacterium]
RARKLLERAGALCTRGLRKQPSCARLHPEILFYLARTYEAQGRLPEAMSDYEQVVARASHARPEHLAEARKGMERLGQRLGRIVVPKQGPRGCQEVSIWMLPGRHLVYVRGRSEQVTVRAQERVQVGACR